MNKPVTLDPERLAVGETIVGPKKWPLWKAIPVWIALALLGWTLVFAAAVTVWPYIERAING